MARLRKRRVMNQINVVPYIDVTLVLLVIFMVTAPMTNPGVVDLPKVGGEILKQQASPIVITLKKNGTVVFQDKSLTTDQLLFEIKKQVQKEPERAFVISADKKVDYEKVVQILALLKKSGAKAGLLLNPTN
jgi:biopolymer transport protein TolR